jgi:hypothetical protein
LPPEDANSPILWGDEGAESHRGLQLSSEEPKMLDLFPPYPTAGRKQFARHEWAQKAAYLLGCSLEELSSAIFKHQLKGGTLQRSTSFRQGPEESGLGEGTHAWGLLAEEWDWKALPGTCGHPGVWDAN